MNPAATVQRARLRNERFEREAREARDEARQARRYAAELDDELRVTKRKARIVTWGLIVLSGFLLASSGAELFTHFR